MESPLYHSITSVAAILSTVDRKISSLLKTSQDEALRSIQIQIPKLRRTLSSLSSQLAGPSSNNAALTNVTSQDGTLLSFTITILVTCINTLKQLEASVKSVKHGPEKKGIFQKGREPVTETDLLVIKEKMQLLDAAMRVVMQLVTIHLGIAAAKINKHDERLHLRILGETATEVQNSMNMVDSLTNSTGPSSSEPDHGDFGKICDFMKGLVHDESRRVETRMTGGFVPMSPLVEVRTNNTLMPSISAISTLGI